MPKTNSGVRAAVVALSNTSNDWMREWSKMNDGVGLKSLLYQIQATMGDAENERWGKSYGSCPIKYNQRLDERVEEDEQWGRAKIVTVSNTSNVQDKRWVRVMVIEQSTL